MEEILKAIASGLKLDAEQFLADFKNGDDFIPEKEVAAKLAAFIPDKVKAANDNSKKVGRSEVNDKLLKIIKKSDFEVPEGLQGDALLQSFLDWKDEQAAGHTGDDPKAMTKDDLLRLPIVRSIVQEVTAKAGEKFTAEKKALEDRVTLAENTRKGFLVEKQMLGFLEKAKVNLGDTPEQKSLRLELLRSRIPLSKIEIGENDSVKLLGADGYETDFEKAVTEIAIPVFGVVTQDKNKGGSGAQGSATGGNAGKTGPTFTFASEGDFNAQYFKASPTDRATMFNDWTEQQKKAAGNAG